jgi:hypothetical protein
LSHLVAAIAIWIAGPQRGNVLIAFADSHWRGIATYEILKGKPCVRVAFADSHWRGIATYEILKGKPCVRVPCPPRDSDAGLPDPPRGGPPHAAHVIITSNLLQGVQHTAPCNRFDVRVSP